MREEARVAKDFELDALKDGKAKNLAYGQQRETRNRSCHMTKTKILFLDEPAAGMNLKRRLN